MPGYVQDIETSAVVTEYNNFVRGLVLTDITTKLGPYIIRCSTLLQSYRVSHDIKQMVVLSMMRVIMRVTKILGQECQSHSSIRIIAQGVWEIKDFLTEEMSSVDDLISAHS